MRRPTLILYTALLAACAPPPPLVPPPAEVDLSAARLPAVAPAPAAAPEAPSAAPAESPPSASPTEAEPVAGEAAVGDETRRSSTHKGTWKRTPLERWRSAIENYAPSVRLGNATALGAARAPFATYLVTMHNRIHPVFADELLGSLGSLPKDHPMNQPQLSARLEIVLDRNSGNIVRMGVIRSSGVTTFDLAALTAVDRARPFGKAPDSIASADGNVYVHWEFHRDPVDACSTRNASPYILKSAP